MYGELRQRPGNLFFSPFSIRVALGMVLAGARGATAEQMRRALRLSSSDETLHAAFGEIAHQLSAPDSDQEAALANAIWSQAGTPLQREFLEVVEARYRARIEQVDFRRDATSIGEAINRWVADATRGRIQNILSRSSLDAETRMVLVNAIYFKGRWVLPFPKEDTNEEPFFLDGGVTAPVPLMRIHDRIHYMRGAGFQAVDMGYRGGAFSMLVLLPDRRDGLADLEASLSARMLDQCAAQLRPARVELFLPRFKFAGASASLRSPLETLGMPLAFVRAAADFSGINGQSPPHEASLFILGCHPQSLRRGR